MNKQKRQIIICKGLPASGKSTWAKQEAKSDNWKRWNNDEARLMFDSEQFNKANEKFINLMRDSFIHKGMEKGFNLIIDNTNLAPKHEVNINQIATVFNKTDSPYEYSVKVKFFEVSLEEAIERDSKRENPVGEKVIKDMYNQFLSENPIQPFYKGNENFPPAIIVDLDGTLAHNNGHRSAYDATKVYDDEINKHILDLIVLYLENVYNVLFVSGREGTEICKSETIRWLNDKCGIHDIEDNRDIFFRKEGDHRNDAIVKEEIFYEHIHDNYNVQFVLDDRDRVVSMWRKKIGLPCLQVNYGNF